MKVGWGAVLAGALFGMAGGTALTSVAQTTTPRPTPTPGRAAPAGASAEASTEQVAPLSSRDVIERLKSLRSARLLEDEMARLFDARTKRMLAEQNRRSAETGTPSSGRRPVSSGSRPSVLQIAANPDETPDLVVKAVTVAPFKEAVVTYRGRVYTVRPGDKLGSIEIRDINESGVVTSGGGKETGVMVGSDPNK